MYGIGYTVGNGTANPGLGMTGWGLYVAANGTSRVFLDSDSGIVISSGSMRTPIFYDSNDTGYYLNPNAGSNLSSLTVVNSITVSSGNATGGGIVLADDGDIVDLNDGYCSMRFSNGVRVFSANRGGSATITLANGGTITASGNVVANSDERLKTDWLNLPSDYIERLADVRHGTYTRTDSW